MSRDKLAALEHVQAIDLQIEELAKKADEFPTRLRELESRAARARVAVDLDRSKLNENDRARRQNEHALAEEKEKIKKWESRLPALKHPREFAALQREVEAGKKSNLAAEEQLQALKADAEGIKATLREKEVELSAREAELNREAGDLKASEAALREKIDALKAQRDTARAACDAKVLAMYESLRKRRPGKAMVPVANGSCTGCNRRLAPQIANRVLSGATLETCPSCYRLLYAPPEAPQG